MCRTATARARLRRTRQLFPFVERIFADAGYQGPKMAAVVAQTGAWALEIVKRSKAEGSQPIAKRWIVERTLAWISRCRRLARDYERYAHRAASAMIRLMLRRCAATPSP